jgi:hypothetical protein
MDLTQALVLVLTFPAVGALLAALTTVEKRLLGEPGSGNKADGATERFVQPAFKAPTRAARQRPVPPRDNGAAAA